MSTRHPSGTSTVTVRNTLIDCVGPLGAATRPVGDGAGCAEEAGEAEATGWGADGLADPAPGAAAGGAGGEAGAPSTPPGGGATGAGAPGEGIPSGPGPGPGGGGIPGPPGPAPGTPGPGIPGIGTVPGAGSSWPPPPMKLRATKNTAARMTTTKTTIRMGLCLASEPPPPSPSFTANVNSLQNASRTLMGTLYQCNRQMATSLTSPAYTRLTALGAPEH